MDVVVVELTSLCFLILASELHLVGGYSNGGPAQGSQPDADSTNTTVC